MRDTVIVTASCNGREKNEGAPRASAAVEFGATEVPVPDLTHLGRKHLIVRDNLGQVGLTINVADGP